MNEMVLEKFKAYFTQLNLHDISVLDEIYAESVAFKDPVHEIIGVENLKAYFHKLNKNLIEGTFLFTDEAIVNKKAYLSWEMNLKLKKPKKEVKASGISVLMIEDKITSQRDYFDAGELFYENVPLLGGVIRALKRKIAS